VGATEQGLCELARARGIRLERQVYRTLIHQWSSAADHYRASKAAVDFPRHGGRRAQRAYLDAVRDLAAHELGLRLIRIVAPECDAGTALVRLESALTNA